jgi:hypothetical protein
MEGHLGLARVGQESAAGAQVRQERGGRLEVLVVGRGRGCSKGFGSRCCHRHASPLSLLSEHKHPEG